jgi:Domain of unknown function (DUF4157)
MKRASLNRKTVRQNPSSLQDQIGGGPNGYSLASPACGIDFFDRQRNAVQTKLLVATAGDQYEQEADCVANEVVGRLTAPLDPSPQKIQPIQPPSMSHLKPDSSVKSLFRRRSGTGGTTVTPEFENSIQAAQGRGRPLASNLRGPMERAFGENFGSVRVHADAYSDRLNRSIRAQAFTVGQDIFFRHNEYQPQSRGGQVLLAHELSHVVQQRENVVQRKIGFELETAIPVSKYIEGEEEKKLTPRAEQELREQLAADSHELTRLAGIKTNRTRVTGHTPFLTWADEWHATTDNAGDRIGKASDANLEIVTHAAEIETIDEAVNRLESARDFVRKVYGNDPEYDRVRIDGGHVYGLPSEAVLIQLFKGYNNEAEILDLFKKARPRVRPDAMVQVNMGVALSQLPSLLFQSNIQFGATAAENPLGTQHKERKGFTSKTKAKEQKAYIEEAKNIHAAQNQLLQLVLQGQSKVLSPYQKKPYWPELLGWLSLLINVLSRATYFPYSHLLKNFTPILSKSPLHLLFQSILDQEQTSEGKKKLAKAVDDAVGINLVPWRKKRNTKFGDAGNYVFTRTVHEEKQFFETQKVKIAGKAFVQLGALTVDKYVAELVKGAKGKDLVTEAILHIKPVEGTKQKRSSMIEPDVREFETQTTGEPVSGEKQEEKKKERVTLGVFEFRSIKGPEDYWPLDKWIDYATPYIQAAELYSRRKT